MSAQEFIPALRFRQFTGLYDRVIAFSMPEAKIRTSLIRQMQIEAGQCVLDFGTGTGSLALTMKKMHNTAEITGVDVDSKALGYARKKSTQAALKILYVMYGGSDLPFHTGSFEKVASCLVFHHLTDAQKLHALVEIGRVLTEKGELHLADWGTPSNAIMHMAFLQVRLLDGFTNTKVSNQGTLPQLIHNAGFSRVCETGVFNTVFGTLRLWKCTGFNYNVL